MSDTMISPSAVSLSCRLSRLGGSPIAARTIELRSTGMRVVTDRPLALDEVLSFELSHDAAPVAGRARVIGQDRHDAYTLRFARLPEAMVERLQDIMAAAD